jgi:transposase
MRMLDQYENAPTPQERNALLRREGLYSAYMTEWRRERDRTASAPATEKKPGRPAKSAAETENERLRKENEQIAAKLAKTEAALEIMGKVHALLETLSGSADSEKNQKQ